MLIPFPDYSVSGFIALRADLERGLPRPATLRPRPTGCWMLRQPARKAASLLLGLLPHWNSYFYFQGTHVDENCRVFRAIPALAIICSMYTNVLPSGKAYSTLGSY